MIYRDFQDVKLSALGMGAMRLPVVDGDDSKIDEAAAFAMVDEAMARGVNYYDTAWGYHNGNSELVMGKALARHPREKFYLATKSNMGKVEEIFEKQLEKCQVEYFDFYLFHNVCEMNIDAYLDPKYGTYDYLLAQKKNGRIRHLGFSAHGDYDVMKRFLEAYGKDMEFCQIQLNYLDWDFQDAKRKVELLNQWNIPVWVMEPLRGGKLASLAPEDETELETLHPIAQGMVKKIVLPCTACHYCTSHCPQGLDIPNLLSLYNEHCFTQGGFIAPMALSAIPADKQPSACIGCRSCEAVCPQGIKISEAMADFTAKLGG